VRVHSFNYLKKNGNHSPSVSAVYVKVQPVVCQLVCQTVVSRADARRPIRGRGVGLRQVGQRSDDSQQRRVG